eukprot:74009_1
MFTHLRTSTMARSYHWLRYQFRKHKYMRLLRYMILIFIIYFIWQIVLNHGVFIPPFVHYSTYKFKTEMNNHPIPTRWKPNFRIVVSFSTLPYHLDVLSETLDSLISQTLKPDQIYLNIPMRSKRTGQQYIVPEYLTTTYHDSLKIIRSKTDYGPLTKLYPTLLNEYNESTLIITVDDDKIYPKNLIQTIAWYSYHYPDIAWSDCGWGFLTIPFHSVGVVPVYVPWIYRMSGGREVEVLQAVCGNAYRRKFFDDLSLLERPTKECYTTDDIWISGYLKFHSKVKRVLMRNNVEAKHTKWKREQHATKWDLSSFNTNHYQDIKCISSIERMYKGKWL